MGCEIRKFTAFGEPRGKQRPRVGHGHGYTPKETRDYEALVRFYYQREHSGAKPFDGKFAIYITAYLGIAKSKPKYVKNEMMNQLRPCLKRPDVDNIAKIILDALNGVAYTDDKNCTELQAMKFWGAPARVKVAITGWYLDEPEK